MKENRVCTQEWGNVNYYADYIKERENLDYLEFKEGFLTYRIEDRECYLANIYVAPEFRGTPAISHFINELSKIAESKNCNFLTANIYLTDHGFNRTLKAALKLAFRVVRAENNSVVIVKKLGE